MNILLKSTVTKSEELHDVLVSLTNAFTMMHPDEPFTYQEECQMRELYNKLSEILSKRKVPFFKRKSPGQ